MRESLRQQVCAECHKPFWRQHKCYGKGNRKPLSITKLHPDSRDLMGILAFLDENNITDTLLERAHSFKRTWASSGDIHFQPPGVHPVFADEQRALATFQSLQSATLVVKFGPSRYSMADCLRREIQLTDSTIWKFEALRMVLHTFPEHRQHDPVLYAKVARDLLPQLDRVLPYLLEEAVYRRLEPLQIAQIVDVCLSASNFRDVVWKERVLKTAETLLRPEDPNSLRIKLRQIALARISQKAATVQLLHDLERLSGRFDTTDNKSNAHLGEMVILRARLLIDLKNHQEALFVLGNFKPWDHKKVSQMEQIVLNDISSIQGEICRFDGRFGDARDCFLRLLQTVPTPPKITTQLSSVHCELGNFRYAIEILTDELETSVRAEEEDTRNATRLRLALADAYLMESITLKLTKQTSEGSLGTARDILKALANDHQASSKLGKVGKINRFRILASLAMIEQVSGDPYTAVQRWNDAQVASTDCWPEPKGHTDMIIMYSLCELKYRLGEVCAARKLEQEAIELYKRTGHKYHFTGLGSIWPKYIEGHVTNHGGRKLE